MSFRNLTSTGDWTWGKGLANYNNAEAEIEEDIATWLWSWVGNCFWALRDGIDYTNLLDIGQQTNMKNAIRLGIMSRNNVVGINSLTVVYAPETRLITVTANIQTVYSSAFQLELIQTAGVPLGH